MFLEISKIWDAVVIGAGPAGSVSAIQLARQGFNVLLVDKAQFPRDKVCGCCLSGKAINALSQLDLSKVYANGVPINSFTLGVSQKLLNFQVQGGIAISRYSLDQQLIHIAQNLGVRFLQKTSAKLSDNNTDYQSVLLKSEAATQEVKAKVVLVCSGIAQGTLQHSLRIEEKIDQNSKIGLTAIIPNDGNHPPGKISMAYNQDGYLGMTVLEDGRLNISAAIKKSSLKQSPSPSHLAEKVIGDAGLNCPVYLSKAEWMGTQELTRKMDSYAARRVFILGDAANYLEPFTGQGMEWAINAAGYVQPFAKQAIINWNDELIPKWNQFYNKRQIIAQGTCKLITFVSRRPTLVAMTVQILRFMPYLSNIVINSIHGKQAKPANQTG